MGKRAQRVPQEGELAIRTAGSHTVVELMRHGRSPEEACKEAVRRIVAQNPKIDGLQVGFLALRADGAYGGWSVYNGFNYALSKSGTPASLMLGTIVLGSEPCIQANRIVHLI
ncbi:MAG: hypothetical protein R2818_12585 [Flavobacteriales bacterium]